MRQDHNVRSPRKPDQDPRKVLKQARWAWKYASAASSRLFLGLVLGTVIASLLPAGLAWAGRGLINAVTQIVTQQLKGIEAAIPWIFLAFGLAASQEIVGALTAYLRTRFDHKLQLKVNTDLLSHAAELDISWFEDPGFQDIAERAQQDTSSHFSGFIDKTLNLTTDVLQVLSLAAILIAVDRMAVVIMLSLILPYGLYRWYFARDRFNKEHARATKRRWSRYFVSLLTGRDTVGEIKISNLAPRLIEQYQRLASGFLAEDRKLYGRDILATALFAVVYLTIFYALFARLVGQVVAGSLTVGDVALFAAAISRIRRVLDSIARSAGGTLEETLYVTNFADLLRVRPRLRDTGRNRAVADRIQIEIHNVSFTYPGSTQSALSDISLRVDPGETIALVGENGAGKTTLVKLIARLYDPDQGSILLNGVDLKEMPLDHLHHQISFVFQSFNRYEALVWENIAFGDLEQVQNPEKAAAVARLAELDEWIQSLPDGYLTRLGRRFGQYDPSPGQWQKIAIARALARSRARLLILDEPTASLDARAEFELFLRFRELSVGRTSIFISHRFSTVRMADRIVVIDHGRIVESGTHAQLVAQDGKYAMLYELHQRQMQMVPGVAES